MTGDVINGKFEFWFGRKTRLQRINFCVLFCLSRAAGSDVKRWNEYDAHRMNVGLYDSSMRRHRLDGNIDKANIQIVVTSFNEGRKWILLIVIYPSFYDLPIRSTRVNTAASAYYDLYQQSDRRRKTQRLYYVPTRDMLMQNGWESSVMLAVQWMFAFVNELRLAIRREHVDQLSTKQ